MATSNAGYATNRQGRFTRSGALRPLRSARLSRCRRFRPSPYLLLPCSRMPSAERIVGNDPSHQPGRGEARGCAEHLCPITPGVTAGRAVRVTVGSGGDSTAFAVALSPAPMATAAPLWFDGNSSPFGLALSSTPIGPRTACGTDFSAAHPCSTEKPGTGILPLRSKPCFSPPDKNMNFLCTTSPFTVPTSDHWASLSCASSPPGSAFYAVYSPHPWGSPFGPACGFSKSLPAPLSVRRLADLLQGYRFLRSLSPIGSWSSLRSGSFRPRLAARPLPFASSCRPILDQTLILLQGTFTPSVHTHAGRTQSR